MLKHTYNIAGNKVPQIVVFSVIAYIGYSIFRGSKNGISTGLANLFKSDTEKQQDAVLQESFKILEKNPNVQSQRTILAKTQANQLYESMSGFGTDEETIFKVFRQITGPNQMAAVFLEYGKRSLGFMYQTFFDTHTGDLITALRSELNPEDLNKNLNTGSGAKWSIETKLNWLKEFK
jgi:hypothetical protein